MSGCVESDKKASNCDGTCRIQLLRSSKKAESPWYIASTYQTQFIEVVMTTNFKNLIKKILSPSKCNFFALQSCKVLYGLLTDYKKLVDVCILEHCPAASLCR